MGNGGHGSNGFALLMSSSNNLQAGNGMDLSFPLLCDGLLLPWGGQRSGLPAMVEGAYRLSDHWIFMHSCHPGWVLDNFKCVCVGFTKGLRGWGQNWENLLKTKAWA